MGKALIQTELKLKHLNGQRECSSFVVIPLPIDDDTVFGYKFRAQGQHCSNREFPIRLSFVTCGTSVTVKLWWTDAPYFIRVWGGDRRVIVNSILFQGFQSPNKENVLRITPLATSSPYSSKHGQIIDLGRHQWVILYGTPTFISQILAISYNLSLKWIMLNSKWDPLYKNHYSEIMAENKQHEEPQSPSSESEESSLRGHPSHAGTSTAPAHHTPWAGEETEEQSHIVSKGSLFQKSMLPRSLLKKGKVVHLLPS